MFRKQKPSTVMDQPDGWNDTMVAEILGTRRNAEGAINMLLLVNEVQKRFELHRGTTDEQVLFTARIAAKEGSLLRSVRAHIRFCEVRRYGRTSAVPPDSVGLLFFSQSIQVNGGPQIPLIEVMLFGGAKRRVRLERYLVNAKHFHAKYVPVWIWVGSTELVPAEAAGALEFSAENQLPISACHWQQSLHLDGPTPQDEFLT